MPDLAAVRASLGPDGTGTHPALDEVAAIEAELRGAGATTSDLATFRDAYQDATKQSQQPLQGLTESRQVFAMLHLPMSDRGALLAELRSLDLIPPRHRGRNGAMKDYVNYFDPFLVRAAWYSRVVYLPVAPSEP